MARYTTFLSLFFLGFQLLIAQEAPISEKELQTRFIMVENGGTINIPAGTYAISASLVMDEKQDVTIQGAGMDKTILSFKSQQEGAEGIRIANSKNITLKGMTVQDAIGDNIKVMETEGITFLDIKVEWTGKPKKTNGAYGIYPVSCTNVLIDGCVAVGASDAGIYVGQSHNIIVRNSKAWHNVAGIEIENSTIADVYNCEAYNNTGGILVFDLPGLPKKKGGNVRVYKNKVWENNYKNFAPKGNSVAFVPPGTGIIVLATNNVEIYENEVTNNRTAPLSIVSYYMTERPIKDKEYYPYPTSIYIHDNQFERDRVRPSFKHKIGLLLFSKFKKDVPDILYDGILDPKTVDENGKLKPEYQICIRNNGNAGFANLDAENNFKNISQDKAAYDCERAELEAPSLSSAEK